MVGDPVEPDGPCAEPGSCQEEADLPGFWQSEMVKVERPAKSYGSSGLLSWPNWAQKVSLVGLKWGRGALSITARPLCVSALE